MNISTLRAIGFFAAILCLVGLFCPLFEIGGKTFPMSGLVFITTFLLSLVAAKIAFSGNLSNLLYVGIAAFISLGSASYGIYDSLTMIKRAAAGNPGIPTDLTIQWGWLPLIASACLFCFCAIKNRQEGYS